LTDRLPALFATLDAVLNGQVQRIEEDAGCDLKAETVLALVGQVLVLSGSGLNWLEPVMRAETDPLRKQSRTMEKLSLNKAAKEASVAKSTLLEALNSGRMSAGKNEKGHWQIDPSELFRVFPRTGPAEHREPKPTPSEVLQKTTENGALEVEVKMLREMLEETRADRDSWKDQAQKITALIEDQSARKKGFWARLVG